MAFKQLEIAATAGNVVTNFVVPNGLAYKVMYGQVVLTTDATAANRRVILTILDSASNTVMDVHAGAVVTASKSNQHLEFMQGIFRETTFIGNALQVPIPLEFWVPAGWTIRIAVEDGVAGDSYTGSGLIDFNPIGRDLHR